MNCPSESMIKDFAAGRVADDSLHSHLQTCPHCRKQVETLERKRDLLVGIAEKAVQESETQSIYPLGEAIPGYRILSIIHRGGQGVVYKAVQETTKRKVALKVLIEGAFATPRERHRFEREIDLIAGLHHPGIVNIYDSGVAPDGRPYFAMEYLHGQPLDEFLSSKAADWGNAGSKGIAPILELFTRICDAVSYAHQRGVIHRDLKPGNINVDSNGQPHVVDFGLAKTTGPELSDGSPVTITGEFMGTLTYASPEQIGGDPRQIDVRTDVYSLGVILYEALTQSFPYPVVGQMTDVARNVVECEPRRPSTLRRGINNEVETIILKCLAKERERRYQSAGELARDITRYLVGEPIEAKRDSTWYLLTKTLRRYKLPAILGSAFLSAGIIIGTIMTFLYFRLERESAATFELYHNAIASATDAIMAFDFESGKFIMVNDAALRLYGYTRDEYMNLTVKSISAEPEKTEVTVPKIASGQMNRVYRLFKRKDGSTFHGEIMTGRFNYKGRETILGVVRTISERETTP